GAGKSSVASVYAYAAALRGEASTVFLFDERPDTFIHRSIGIGLDIGPHLESGRITLRQINTAEVTPGEFTEMICKDVHARGVKVVVIDSLTGYMSAMPNERQLVTQMHDILSYLSGQGVLSILIVAQHGVLGSGLAGPVDVSYLADTVLLLRHFEAEGEIRQAISVFKRRYGPHEKRIRMLRISSQGVEVGEPIEGFSGVLTGTPSFTGQRAELLDRHDTRGES
ncbi:MAG: circadian clock protein KaiC, partial [Gemmatimonadota bacterium]|nr:circadian clock protein KaiC [Gemmatimonadota bacterium]